MPITIVCDDCGKKLRPVLWRRAVDAGISVSGLGVTFACTPDGTVIVACSDPCRRHLDLQQRGAASVS